MQVEWKSNSIKVIDKATSPQQVLAVKTPEAFGEATLNEEELTIVSYCGSIPTHPQPTFYFLCNKQNFGGDRNRRRSKSSSPDSSLQQDDVNVGDRPKRAAKLDRPKKEKKVDKNFTICRLWCDDYGKWSLEHTFIFERQTSTNIDFVVATHQDKKTGNLKVFTRDRPYMCYFEIDLRGGRVAPLVHEKKRIDQLCTVGRVPEHYSFLTRKNDRLYECDEWRGIKWDTARGRGQGRGEEYYDRRKYRNRGEDGEMKEEDKDQPVMLSFESAQKMAVSLSYILFPLLLYRPFKPYPLRVLCMAVNLTRVSPLISLELEIKGGTSLEEVSTTPISVNNSLYLFVFNPTTVEYALLALNRGDIIEIRSFGRDASFTQHATSAIPDKSCRVKGVWQWDCTAEKLHYSALAMKRSKVQGPHLNMQQHVLVDMIFRL